MTYPGTGYISKPAIIDLASSEFTSHSDQFLVLDEGNTIKHVIRVNVGFHDENGLVLVR